MNRFKFHRTVMTLIEREGYVTNCERCDADLYPAPPAPYGFFMLSNALWAVVSLDQQIKCLCLACTEEILGARLPSWTFRVDQMSPPSMLTPELRDRLNKKTDGEFNLAVDEERAAISARVFPDAKRQQG